MKIIQDQSERIIHQSKGFTVSLDRAKKETRTLKKEWDFQKLASRTLELMVLKIPYAVSALYLRGSTKVVIYIQG